MHGSNLHSPHALMARTGTAFDVHEKDNGYVRYVTAEPFRTDGVQRVVLSAEYVCFSISVRLVDGPPQLCNAVVQSVTNFTA